MRGLVFLLLSLTLNACTVDPPPTVVPNPAPAAAARPLPPVVVEQLAEREPARVAEGEPLGVPVGVPGAEERPRSGNVTLTAVGTDVRSLLAVLAEAAGVDLVVGPAVTGRVTVHLEDVPAREALERVVRETGHMITRPLEVPFPPTVFYVMPVNMNEADAATIQVHFGVSAEMARFIVRSRVPPN